MLLRLLRGWPRDPSPLSESFLKMNRTDIAVKVVCSRWDSAVCPWWRAAASCESLTNFDDLLHHKTLPRDPRRADVKKKRKQESQIRQYENADMNIQRLIRRRMSFSPNGAEASGRKDVQHSKNVTAVLMIAFRY
jgi:hypothetical protein